MLLLSDQSAGQQEVEHLMKEDHHHQQQEQSFQSMSLQQATELDPVYAQFRDQTRFWIQRVAVPLLMVIGLFGNLITVIIMTRRRMRSTTNMYLAALAFVDMLYLVLTFILGLSHYPNMAGQRYYAYWKLRPFLMMLTDACSNTSVWLTVTFTIERFIAVKYPMKGKVWCTEARAKMLIVCVFAFGILFAAPVPFEWKVIEKRVTQPVTHLTTTTTTTNQTSPTQYPLMNEEDSPFKTNYSTSKSPTHDDSNDADKLNLSESISHFGGADGDANYYSGQENKSDSGSGDGSQSNSDKGEEDLNVKYTTTTMKPPTLILINDTFILALDYSDFGRNETYKTIYYWSTAVIFYFIPLFSLMLFNGFLIKSVHQSKRERTRMTQMNRPSTTSTQCSNLKSENLTANGTRGDSNSANNQTVRIFHNGSGSRGRNFRTFDSFRARHKGDPGASNDGQAAAAVSNESSHKSPLLGRSNSTQAEPNPKPLANPTAEADGRESNEQAIVLIEPRDTTAHNDSPNSGPEIKKISELNVQINCDRNESLAGNNSDISSSKWKAEEDAKEEKTNNPSREEGDEKKEEENSSLHLNDGPNQQRDCCQDTIKTIGPVCSSRYSPLRRSQHTNSSARSQQSFAPASSQERRITIMLIAVVILFLVCQIPSAAMLLYTSVHELVPNTNEHALVLAFGNIFNFLMAVNAAGNFILYSFLSKKYRKTFMILFCSCFGSKKQSEPRRLFSVRFESSSQLQNNSGNNNRNTTTTSSIYQDHHHNKLVGSEKVYRDTLV